MDDRIVGVKQSSDGFLWVATFRGVMRFDGVEFKSLAMSQDLSAEKRIVALFVDSRDRLWIARRNGEILCMDQGSVVMKMLPESIGLESGLPSIIEAKDGEVMVCLPNGGLFRVRNGNVEYATEADPLCGENRQVVKDGLGQIWLSLGDQGFGMIKDGRFSLLGRLPVARLAGARSGGVWICSGHDLWRYTEAGSLKKICTLLDLGEPIKLNVVYEDSQGGLWFGSELSGLFHFDNDRFTRVPVPSLKITSIEEDRAGNIWAGTWDGLNQLTPAVVRFLKSGTDKRCQNVISLCEDKAGSFWAVWSSGLISKSPNSNLWESAALESWSLIDEQTVPLAQCVVADPTGGVWFGTEASGVVRWQDGGVTTNLNVLNGLAGEAIYALHVSRDGALWIGIGQPEARKTVLQRWQSGRFQSYPLPLDSELVTAITSDANSNIWCATCGGTLFRVGRDGRIVNETATFSPGRYSILSLCATSDNTLWIGFSGQGLGRLKNGRFSRYGSDQGVRENVIARIMYDGSDRLWIAGNKGLFSVRLEDFDEVDAGRSMRVQSVVYGKREGLLSSRSTAFFCPGAIRDTAGRLLFGMTGGIAVISPEVSRNRQPPPSVVIDRVQVDGRTVAAFGAEEVFPASDRLAPLNLWRPCSVRLRIPPGARHLEFSFTVLDFKMPESSLFRCRLHGLVDEWSEIGSQRSVSYFDIPPGDYQFQVMACNSDGVWNQAGASIALTIEAYWWETAWFRVGGPLAAAGLLLGGLLFFLRRRQKLQIERLKLLQATEKERARIAADLHDDLGSGLTEIAMTGDLVLQSTIPVELSRQYVGEIVGRTRELTEALDEIVWAANPKHDTVASLVGYSVRYIQRIMKKMPVQLRLDIERNLPVRAISAVVRHHLFLALREAVTNIVRHAGATEVSLTVAVQDDKLVLTIQDNGQGMDVTAATLEGDGLSNMRSRLEKIDGTCLIDSAPGKGTRMTFEIKL